MAPHGTLGASSEVVCDPNIAGKSAINTWPHMGEQRWQNVVARAWKAAPGADRDPGWLKKVSTEGRGILTM